MARITHLLLFLVLFSFASCLSFGLSFDAGIRLPFSYEMNFAGNAGYWSGFSYGGGLTAGLGFLENALFTESRFGADLFVMYTSDVFFLPVDQFAENSFISSRDLRYGLDLKFFFLKNWNVGAGITFAYIMGGEYGTPDNKTDFTEQMTGNDIYLSFLFGYDLEIVPDKLFLPLQCKVNMSLTVPNALVLEAGLNLSLVYRFPIREQPENHPVILMPIITNVTNHSTATVTNNQTVSTQKTEMKKYSVAEIQKMSVPEIIKLSKEALRLKENETARVLIKEGLLKEPDNAELIRLFTELMK